MEDDDSAPAWQEPAIALVSRVSAKLDARLTERLRATRTNAARWRVLAVLSSYGPLRIGDIVARALMGQPTVSRVVDQLVREGCVLRSRDKRDSRVVRVSLSPKGTARLQALVRTAAQHEAIALRGLSRTDILRLGRVIRAIEANLGAADDQALAASRVRRRTGGAD